MNEPSILLVEDNMSFALEVEMIINDLGYDLIATVGEAREALAIHKKRVPDLIITDVHLKGEMDGIQMMEEIKDFSGEVIFMTQCRDENNYKRARNLRPVAYLVKPFDKYSLQSCIETAFAGLTLETRAEVGAFQQNNLPEEKNFFIRQNNVLSKVNIVDIQSVHSDGNYCEIVLKDAKKYVVKMSLLSVLKKLPPEYFIRIHQRYAVQVKLIEAIDTVECKALIGKNAYPIGRTYKAELLKRFNRL